MSATPIPPTATDISHMLQKWKLKLYCYNLYQILHKLLPYNLSNIVQIKWSDVDPTLWDICNCVGKLSKLCVCVQMWFKMIIVGATYQAVRGKRIITSRLLHWCRFWAAAIVMSGEQGGCFVLVCPFVMLYTHNNITHNNLTTEYNNRIRVKR